MPLAGETIVAGKVPGERVATNILTADSAGVTTTETSIQNVVAPVVAGRIYRVTWYGDLASTVAGDQFLTRIREDTAAGNVLDFRRYRANSVDNLPFITEVEYTADATEDKTFHLTLIRSTGTGTGRRDASTTSPSYMYVEYVRDA